MPAPLPLLTCCCCCYARAGSFRLPTRCALRSVTCCMCVRVCVCVDNIHMSVCVCVKLCNMPHVAASNLRKQQWMKINASLFVCLCLSLSLSVSVCVCVSLIYVYVTLTFCSVCVQCLQRLCHASYWPKYALLCFALLAGSSRAWAEQSRAAAQRSALNNQKSYQFINHACSHLTFFAPLAAPHTLRRALFASFRFVCCFASFVVVVVAWVTASTAAIRRNSLAAFSLTLSRSPSPQHNEACLVSGGGGQATDAIKATATPTPTLQSQLTATLFRCTCLRALLSVSVSVCVCMCVCVCVYAGVCVVCVLHALCPPPSLSLPTSLSLSAHLPLRTLSGRSIKLSNLCCDASLLLLLLLLPACLQLLCLCLLPPFPAYLPPAYPTQPYTALPCCVHFCPCSLSHILFILKSI